MTHLTAPLATASSAAEPVEADQQAPTDCRWSGTARHGCRCDTCREYRSIASKVRLGMAECVGQGRGGLL